jgi:hypothetical protein
MLGGIIPYPAGRGEYNDRRIGGEQVEKTERTQVYMAFFIDRGCQANGSRGYQVLEVVLFLRGGEILEVEYHGFYLTAENKRSLRFRRVKIDKLFDESLL